MFAYTWSRLWGNYTGLTTTDQNDGGQTGRDSPDTTRAFDEPFYYFTAAGTSINGPLPTDRPNTFKGYVYYSQPWNKTQTTTIGLLQVAYQGSPVSTYADLGYANGVDPVEATYIYGHGKWANVSTDPSGNITVNGVTERRTPWYTQSDLNLKHEMKINKNKEQQMVAVEATISNLFDQRAVTSYNESLNGIASGTPLLPHGVGVFQGAATYQAYETGYNAQQAITNSGVILGSQYGKPNIWQLPRTIRFTVRYTF